MYKLFKASKDASVYAQIPMQNSGLGEILEVGKLYNSLYEKDISRSLIQFDMNEVSKSLAGVSNWKAFLSLKASNSMELPLNYTIYANAVSESWEMGTGTKYDNMTTDGVSWNYRDGEILWQTYGGTWYNESEASQSFVYQYDDIHMDITGIVNMWINGDIENNGLIIRNSLEHESDNIDYGVLKFYSKETNTIYEPKLELAWDDSSYNTGSLSIVTGDIDSDYKLVLNNLKTKYQKDTLVKIRIKGRDAFPLKSFNNKSFAYEQVKALPETIYYQLEDYITGDIIFPFSDYTKVSCDSISNYFDIDLSNIAENRAYRLKFKIVNNNSTTIIDNKFTFEIV